MKKIYIHLSLILTISISPAYSELQTELSYEAAKGTYRSTYNNPRDISFSEVFGAAFRLHNILGVLMENNRWDTSRFGISDESPDGWDVNLYITDDERKQFGSDLDILLEARNERDLRVRRARLQAEYSDRDLLNQ